MSLRKIKTAFSLSVVFVMSILLIFSLSGCSKNEDAAPTLGEAKLSSPTIKENGTLKVGVNTSQSPLAGMGNSKIIGIDVDIAAALADSLGLKLQIIDTGSTPSKAISNGDVDIVFGIDKSDAPSGVKLTDAYIPTAVAYYKKANSSPVSLTGEATPKIAAQGSSKSAWAATNAFGTSAVTSTTDLASAFQSLANGSVDYVASDAVIGMYAASKAGVKVEIAGIADSASGYCVGMSDKNTALISDISTALKNLVDNGTVETIERKWMGDEISLSGVQTVQKKSSGESSSSSESSSSGSSSSSSGSASGTTATDANSVTDTSGY